MSISQSIKKFSWLVLLASGAQAAHGFALLGPTGNGGDAWQTGQLGYPIPGDIGSAKNFSEEYRRNTPVMYYGFDTGWLTYFGTDGILAVDGAFGVMNTVSNVDSYSPSLSEFPLYSQHYNATAQTLLLTDVKSVILGTMVEEMGLADPVKYTWTLRARQHVGNIACPVGEEYLVVQRNFAVDPTQPVQYSPYVNGVLYSYNIAEGCGGGAVTVPFSVDPLALIDTPVASFPSTFISKGYFYSGVTLDDVAGMRYLYSSNNINMESPAAGSLLLVTNSNPNVLVITQPLSLLSAAATNDPATAGALIPGGVVASSTNWFKVVVTTNFTAYYTNYPGPSVTNYWGPAGIQLLSTMDLGLFLAQAATNPPATMLALYSNLVIVGTPMPYFGVVTNWNVSLQIVPLIGGPAGSTTVKAVTNGYTLTFPEFFNYSNSFANIVTNHYSSNSIVTVQSVYTTNLIGSPAVGTIVVVSNSVMVTNNLPGGDFYIVPTNWCGFQIEQVLPSQVLGSSSNTVFLSSTNGTTTATNGLVANGTQTTITTFTNYTYVIEPGTCEPALVYATNYTTNIATVFQTTFANIITNHYYSNTVEIVVTTNIGPYPGGITNTLSTNITTNTVILTNVPSGDFWVQPPTWCGYQIVSDLQSNAVATTNTLIATNATGIADIGQQFIQTTYDIYTNHALVITPLTCPVTTGTTQLREGIGRIQFVKVNYDSLVGQLFQPVTNFYTMTSISNSQTHLEYYERIVTTPDITFAVQDRASLTEGGIAFLRSIAFNQANILPGLAGPGTIDPPITITMNRSAPYFYNASAFTTNFFFSASENTQTNVLAWGSFDSSTNPPIVYPDGMSIQNLENEIILQISPTFLPDGTNGVPYLATTFTTAGGGAFSLPFTWSVLTAGGLSPVQLPPNGLTLSSDGTLSGTPAGNAPGTYDFTIQATDQLGRTVDWNYSITIDY